MGTGAEGKRVDLKENKRSPELQPRGAKQELLLGFALQWKAQSRTAADKSTRLIGGKGRTRQHPAKHGESRAAQNNQFCWGQRCAVALCGAKRTKSAKGASA